VPTANTIKRQVGGGLVSFVGQPGTLAPIVNPGTDTTNFELYGLDGRPGDDTFGNNNPAQTINLTSPIAGGVVPLAAGNFTDAPPTFATDYQGTDNPAPNFRGVYEGSGQVLHLAVTGSYSGMTANSTTIALGLYEVPAALIQTGGLNATSQAGFNSVCESSGVQVPSASGQFTFDVYIQLSEFDNSLDITGDVIGCSLSGYYEGQIGLTTPLTPGQVNNVTGLVGDVDLNFVLAATLGVSAPSTAVLTVDEFRIDLESPGASTIRLQSEGGTFATIVNPSTTPTAFSFSVPPLFNGASATNMGGVIPLAAGVTGLYAGTGAVLVVGAAGTIAGVTGGATTLTLDLYEIPAAVVAAGLTPTSFAGWNKVGTSGAKQIGSATDTFQFNAKLQLDAEGNLQGTFTTSISSATPTQMAAINGITGLVGEADLNFVLVATLGVSAPPTSLLTLNAFTLTAQ
jgi:hypothetical protein